MKLKLLLLSFLFLFSAASFAQTDTESTQEILRQAGAGTASSDMSNSVVFFPPGLNFLPLRANNQEAKLGILYYPNSTNLKLDIGNTMDLIRFNLQDNKYITLGIEFMAYAYSVSFSQMRLQIGTLDGFFGGNAVYTNDLPGNRFSTRLRYIHNSAHLVDGFYSDDDDNWLNNKEPIPFTRDFAEVIFADEFPFHGAYLRPYIGGSYSVRVRPSVLKRTSFCTGIEAHTGSDVEPALVHHHFFFAYHFLLAGLPVYQASHQVQIGVKFGNWQSKGVNFFLSYFNGNNMFNEFYYERIDRFGVGFSVDFP